MDYFRTLTLHQNYTTTQGKRTRKKGPGALWDSYYRPAVFFVDIEIYEKFQITCDFVVNIL